LLDLYPHVVTRCLPRLHIRDTLKYCAERDLPSILTDVNSNYGATDLRNKFHQLKENIRRA
jgi:hypothetical protein